MDAVKEYTLQDFDYALPEHLIAKYPLSQRQQSRMLLLNRQTGEIQHQVFESFAECLNPGDVLVLNNAKVIPARLKGVRQGHTGTVELFLLHSEDPDQREWQVLMRPARRLSVGMRVQFAKIGYNAEVLMRLEEGKGLVRLDWPAEESFEDFLNQVGSLPIPPYLAREPEAIDQERYQTVFAKVAGAQAAPTAGLHFTTAVLSQLQQKGVEIVEITLHVSAGTFRPVLHDEIAHHQMEPEFYTVSEEVASRICDAKQQGRRVVAVGTTVMKTLETVALNNQGQMVAASGASQLFIRPGFSFQVVDALLTNFHLPKSTLLMLVSAFAGYDSLMKAYQAAVMEQYRFYSYGDCMLIQ